MTSDTQQIMQHYTRIIGLRTREERSQALEAVPPHQQQEVRKRVTEYFEVRHRRRIAQAERTERELKRRTP